MLLCETSLEAVTLPRKSLFYPVMAQVSLRGDYLTTGEEEIGKLREKARDREQQILHFGLDSTSSNALSS